ncbi:Glycosyltransferase [Vibrio crassostreae]|nr:Glycosyltransferase [Vibrio crassostreae]
MTSKKVAIAMSVYKSDTMQNVRLSVESLLSQTYDDIDIFIQVDGYISQDCRILLEEYSKLSSVFVTWHEENRGLATRLNKIIEDVISKGGYEFIARMDADDISFPERIFEQVNFLKENLDVSVVGTDSIEISDTGKELFNKKMSYNHDDIYSNIIKKCPFSHPTVMFRVSVFRDSNIRYKSELMNTQDYYLWVDLLKGGYKFANISKPLLYFRINKDFHSRRGWSKANNDLCSRVYAFRNLKVLSVINVFYTISLYFLRVSPKFFRKFAYQYFR